MLKISLNEIWSQNLGNCTWGLLCSSFFACDLFSYQGVQYTTQQRTIHGRLQVEALADAGEDLAC